MDAAKEQPAKEPIGGPVEDPAPLHHDVLARAKASPVRCPFCHADVRVDVDPWVACQGCLARHHAACWGERGRCSACGSTTALRPDLPARPAVLSRAALPLVLGVVLGLAVLAAGAWLGSEMPRVAVRPPEPVRPLARAVEATTTAPRLSHVAVGQVYAYALTPAGGQAMQMDFRVLELGERSVKYSVQVSMDLGQGLAPVGEPTRTEWRHEVPLDSTKGAEASRVETTRESIRISGVVFDCLVVTSGSTRSWVPTTGDLPTFPGIIRTETDGKVTMELIRISR